MRLILEFKPEMYADLLAEAEMRGCTPRRFCAEAVEVLLADQRVQRLRPEDAYARKGPRQHIAETGETET
jgi:hypothetical protein